MPTNSFLSTFKFYGELFIANKHINIYKNINLIAMLNEQYNHNSHPYPKNSDGRNSLTHF